jgi:antitoxin HigA-1
MARTRKRTRAPIHPGETLNEEFLKPLAISANRLGIELRVPANRITEILNGARGISADTALRLARYFGTTPEFWMNLQRRFDLETAKGELGEKVAREVRPRAA